MKNHRYLAKFRTESQEKNIKIIEAESYRAAYDQMCLIDGYKNFNTIDIGGTNIKGYDSGKIYNDLFVLLDISRTGMSATDTDLMLIDIANSLTTTLRRTIKIKARTSASDSAVTTLQSKNVAIQIV